MDAEQMGRRVLYIQYTNPAGYPPLEHSSRILAEAGWQVLFLGTGALGAGSLRFLPHERIIVKLIPFAAAGWQQKLHYLRFVLWVCGWAVRWRPEWVYASDMLASPVAWLLSFWWQGRVVYHEHDSPNGTGNSVFQRLCLATRHCLASRVRLCVLPNQRRLEKFKEDTQATSELLCVWNCPRLDEIVPPRSSQKGDMWVLYHGSIVPDRLPPTVIEALAQLPDSVKLRVMGYETVGHKGYVNELKKCAATLGVAARVEFAGTIPQRSDLLTLCHQCDVGLAFMPMSSSDVNLQAMTGASNKPFDYLACGLALLVSDLPDWRNMYVTPGYGLACDPNDPESIASALYWFAQHPGEMQAMGERGRQRIVAEWNYEAQFAPVLAIIS